MNKRQVVTAGALIIVMPSCDMGPLLLLWPGLLVLGHLGACADLRRRPAEIAAGRDRTV